MPYQNRAIQEFSLNYAAGQTRQDELTRGGIVRSILCRLTGQLTCTSGNNTAPKTLAGDALAVLQKLRVRINSTEHVRELDPRGILVENWFLRNRFCRDRLGELGNGSTANPSFDIVFQIPFELPRSKVRMPVETALDTRASVLSKLEVEVEWGSHLSINGDATGFTVAPTLKVASLHSFNVPDEAAFGYLRGYKIQQTLQASNPRELIRLPTAHTYFGMVLNTVDDGVDAINILNNIKLQTGAHVFEDWDPQVLNQGYGVLWHDRDTIQDEALISTQFNPRAYYPIERPYDGNLQEMLSAARLAELDLELDATHQGGVNVINVHAYQFVPPPRRG